MHITNDRQSITFFAWLGILLLVSLVYGYVKLVAHQDFAIYTDEAEIPSYIISSADAQ